MWRIMSKAWCEQHDAVRPVDVRKGTDNYASTHANGTGPFLLKSRQPGVRTVLEVNPNWWGKPEHNLTEVVFTPIGNDATRVAALVSGEIDMMQPVPLQDVARLESDRHLKVMQTPEIRTIFLGMDQNRDELLFSNVKGKNPFKDKRVRQAIYQAIDIEAIKNRVMRGASAPTALMVAPGINGYRGGTRQTAALRPRCGKAPPRGRRLPERLRGRDELPERSLRQRRGDLPGDRRDARPHRHQGQSDRRDQGGLLSEDHATRHLVLPARLDAAKLRQPQSPIRPYRPPVKAVRASGTSAPTRMRGSTSSRDGSPPRRIPRCGKG